MEHSSSTNKIPTALLRHTSFKTEEKFSKQHEKRNYEELFTVGFFTINTSWRFPQRYF